MITRIEIVYHSDAWGCEATREEHVSACERMTDFLSDHEGPNAAITVRPSCKGEVDGKFIRSDNGNLWPMNEIDEQDLDLGEWDLEDLLGVAYETACKSWPTADD